ncbi:MAG TPA: cupin domain-containing protein, partial [Steroidobacteraceae bacterium]|nr:cupin domain-containing protein [Steroidobacteraceae bacterium]
MDALSDVLRAVKLTGAVFFNAECKAPWCMRSPPSERLREHIGAASSRVIEFHFVTQGRGYIRVGEESTPLMAGDIVMLPHGDEHVMGNGIATEIIDGEASIPNLKSGEIGRARIGGAGEPTRFICGFLVCDARLIQPIVAGLPRALRVHIRADAAGEWLENTFQNAVGQAANATPGSEIVVARLAEVLFAETLRRYLLQLPEGRSGWLAGAGDSAVSRVLAACHREPARDWTLDSLAEEAG